MVANRDELICLIDNKLDKIVTDSWYSGNGAHFTVFESHLVKCGLNSDNTEFWAEIDLGFKNILTEYQRFPFISGTKEQEIVACLNHVELCCRSYLSDKFLIAKGWKKGVVEKPLREKDRDKWRKEHADYIKKKSTNKVGTVKDWADNFIKATKNYFGNRISELEITKIEDLHPRDSAFYIKFRMYDCFDMTGGGGLGLRWSINKGDYLIELPTSQHWLDVADFEEFFKDMEEELELRLPDDYLKAKGWLK